MRRRFVEVLATALCYSWLAFGALVAAAGLSLANLTHIAPIPPNFVSLLHLLTDHRSYRIAWIVWGTVLTIIVGLRVVLALTGDRKKATSEKSRAGPWLTAAAGFVGVFVGLLRDGFVVLGIALALFVAANFGAYRLASSPQEPDDIFAHVDWPGSPHGLAVLKRIFGTNDDAAAMARFDASPHFSMHPTLQFITEPVDNPYFHIGLEGIRYEPDWNDATVRSLLSGNTPLIFAFGGSTMLGHGLASKETLPYYINKIVRPTSGAVTLNFGSQAYTEDLEVAKLIYLLKAGYRPKQVFFLDGLNDLLILRSNMRLVDKVVYHGFAVSRGEVAFTPDAAYGRVSYLKLFLDSLPLYRALRRKFDPKSTGIKFDRDAFTDGFDFREADYLFRNWVAFDELHRDQFKNEFIEYYRDNLDLLDALSRYYKFDFTVFFQPVGLFDQANPFVLPGATNAAGYRYLGEMFGNIRDQIKTGGLPIIDLSDALNGLQEDRYIDVGHYTPASNQRLAKAISQYLLR